MASLSPAQMQLESLCDDSSSGDGFLSQPSLFPEYQPICVSHVQQGDELHDLSESRVVSLKARFTSTVKGTAKQGKALNKDPD